MLEGLDCLLCFKPWTLVPGFLAFHWVSHMKEFRTQGFRLNNRLWALTDRLPCVIKAPGASERGTAGINIPPLGDAETEVQRVKCWAQRALPMLRGRARSWAPPAQSPVLTSCTTTVRSLWGDSRGAQTRILALCLEHLLIALFIWNSEYMCPDLYFLPAEEKKKNRIVHKNIARMVSEDRLGPGETQHWETIFNPPPWLSAWGLLFKSESKLYNSLALTFGQWLDFSVL